MSSSRVSTRFSRRLAHERPIMSAVKVYVPRDAAAPRGRRRQGGQGARRGGRRGHRDHPQRLARAALARADGRSGDARGPHRLRSGEAEGRPRACSPPACCRAATTPLRLGKPEEIPYLAKQARLTFERCGIIDPLDLADYRAHGGYVGLKKRSGDERRGHHRGGHQVRAARARRRRLPDRHQVDHGAQGTGRPEIHRLQRRRGGFRHVRGPYDHGGRPVRPRRGA